MQLNIGLFLIAFAWCVPNFSYPWMGFWLAATACMGVLFSSINLLKINVTSNVIIYPLLITSTTLILIDLIFRNNIYLGDYALGIGYLLIFFLSFLIGSNLQEKKDRFFLLVTAASTISACIALVQWLQPEFKSLYIREIPWGGRAFANTGQPNHLATILSFGIICLIGIKNKISILFFSFILFILCFAMALTQSRTGLLQLAALPFLVFLLDQEKPKKIVIFIAPLITSLVATILVEKISAHLNQPLSRDMLDTGISSQRYLHWQSLLEAVLKQPFFGYGWLHTPEAHLMGSNQAAKEFILPYAHNIIIDMYIWFGVIGGSLLTFSTTYLYKTIISQNKINSANLTGILGISVFLIHSILEYPFAYLHLLIPAGIFMGIGFKKDISHKKIPTPFKLTIIVSCSLIFLAVSYDYLKTSSVIEARRFSYLGVITPEEEKLMPNMIVLDQLKAWIEYSYETPKKNTSKAIALDYEKAALRFGTNRIVLHAAVAHHFSENHEKSLELMNNLCKINTEKECHSYQEKYRQLISIN